jgi:hypothetical protein
VTWHRFLEINVESMIEAVTGARSRWAARVPADALDETYFRLLPSGQSTVTAEEAAMLAAVFGEDGELPARPAGTSRWSDLGSRRNAAGARRDLT